MSGPMPGTCPCEYDGLDENGRVKWRTERCPEHGPKPEKCEVCQDARWTVKDGLCLECRVVARCEEG